MNLLICIFLSLIFFKICEKQIKKYAHLFYTATVIMAVAVVFAPRDLGFEILNYPVNQILKKGVLAGALYILVMYAVLMPKKSFAQKVLMNLRAEIAIMASIISLIHNISYGKKYFVLLFTDISVLKPYELYAAVISVIMILLLIPLTITSFKVIRKKMNPKTWKNLQRTSYLFYALLYTHIVIIYAQGIERGELSYLIDFIIYSLIFISYAVLRIDKYLKNKANKTGEKKKYKNVSVFLYVIGTIAFICLSFSGFTYMQSFAGNKSDIASVIGDGEVTSEENGKSNNGSENHKGYKDGVYKGEAMGYNGKVELEVSVEGGVITSIEIIKTLDDDEYFLDAKDKVIADILEKQSTEGIDTLSGATTSSKAIIKAVEKALNGE